MRVDKTNWGWISGNNNMYFKLNKSSCTMLNDSVDKSYVGNVYESDLTYLEIPTIQYFIMPKEFFTIGD
jgi:hypothetical protein